MVNPNEKLPLAGLNVLVTRAVVQAGDLTEGLESKGATVHVIPAVLMEAVGDPAGIRQLLDDPGSYDHLVFTSVNGVEFFLNFLENDPVGKTTAVADLPPALCVGSRTASAWKKAGGSVGLVPDKYTAHGLLEMLEPELSGQRFAILRPREITTALGELIRARGGEVEEVILYRTVVPEQGAVELEAVMESGLDVLTFASPSAVKGIITLGARSQEPGARNLLGIQALCIGPTTAEAAREAGFTDVHYPAEHTAEGMIEMLIKLSAGS